MLTGNQKAREFDAYACGIVERLGRGPYIRVAFKVLNANLGELRAVLRQCAATDCPNGAQGRAWFNAYTGDGRDRLYCTEQCRRRTTQRTYRGRAKVQTT